MTLTPSEIRGLFARECSFPADRDHVLERAGDIAIESPNGTSVAVETVLARAEQARYASVAELHDTVLAHLGDDHVGRKAYDDRSSNPRREDEVAF